MIQRPPGVGAFQFVILATLRAGQLIRGCRPTVDGSHKPIVTAQLEVAEGNIRQLFDTPAAVTELLAAGEAIVEVPAVTVQPT